MLLSATEQDALSEIINIGFGRAASALSMLVGQRILLETPILSVYSVHDLEGTLEIPANQEITTVHQVFTGTLSGDAMLIMDTFSAATLADLLSGGPGTMHELTAEDQEMIGETGNILLNAFIGSFGNLLQVHISFTVPKLRVESVNKMLRTLVIDNREVEYALVVRVNFRLTKGDVTGYVIIVMGIQSMEALVDAMREAGYLRATD